MGAADVQIEKVQGQFIFVTLGAVGLQGEDRRALAHIQQTAEQVAVIHAEEGAKLRGATQLVFRQDQQFQGAHHQLRFEDFHIPGGDDAQARQGAQLVQILAQLRLPGFAKEFQRPVGEGHHRPRKLGGAAGQHLPFQNVAPVFHRLFGQGGAGRMILVVGQQQRGDVLLGGGGLLGVHFDQADVEQGKFYGGVAVGGDLGAVGG